MCSRSNSKSYMSVYIQSVQPLCAKCVLLEVTSQYTTKEISPKSQKKKDSVYVSEAHLFHKTCETDVDTVGISLTFCENRSSRPVIVNHLDISIMDVTEKNAIGPSCILIIVKGQRYDVLEISRIFIRLDRWVQVILIWKMDAFQYGPFRVE